RDRCRNEHGELIKQGPGATTFNWERGSFAIEEHFRLLEDDLEWLFDYWLPLSEDLRQYLWAHQEEDVVRARTLVRVLPPDVLRRILRYLVSSYWEHYIGWPDLVVYDETSFFFAEVKGSGDRLSEEQKRWIKDNHDVLRLPFKLVKVHRQRDPA
ncbi:MAG: VRR-NUC domain-containing protein, partial [Armatimonadetes bacterium]|nr:VRR-NUC domain-containing protein [Armatimonadota bacterium]